MKILRKKYKNNKMQSGRSMVEILGVLAIIGILSLAALFGYKYAMETYKYNETIREMELRRTVTTALAYTDFNGIVENPEGGNFFRVGYPVEVEVLKDMELRPFFSITIKDVPSKQCKKLIESPWLSTAKVVELWIKNEKTEEDQVFSYKDFINPNVCGTAINNDMTFFFYADEFLRSILWPCERDSDCAMKCNTCEDGVCVNKKNKVYYYGKCYVGNPCTDAADWDWVDNKCICKNGANYVFGQCVPDTCEKGAKWDASLQKCICTDSDKEYDELTKTCIDKTCPEGESLSYFYYADYPNVKTLYKRCCPNGRVAASILPNGTYHSTSGFCCPEGYVQKTGNIYVRTYCSLPLCEDDSLVPTPYQLQGATMYKCCPEGTEAAATNSSQSSTVGGICCQPGEMAVEGKSGDSYCVPKECGATEKRLQVLFPNAGGHNYGDFYIPICCPQTSEYAAMQDSQLKSYPTGVCCKEGEIIQRSNGMSACAIARCPKEGEELVTFGVNYSSRNMCCPTGRKAATTRLPSATQSYAHSNVGICCEEGEKSVGADYRSYCIPNSCPAGKHLVPFKMYSQTGYMCCDNDVLAARWTSTDPVCCKAGEIVNGTTWGSTCVPTNCKTGEEMQSFYMDDTSSYGQKCCPAGQKAARYRSDSTQNSLGGVCCEKGEEVFKTKEGDFCQKTSCGLSEHILTYKYNSVSYNKCCPKSSKAAAFKNYDGQGKIAGVCCGENAIKVNEQCQACPVGKRPNESGTTCQ